MKYKIRFLEQQSFELKLQKKEMKEHRWVLDQHTEQIADLQNTNHMQSKIYIAIQARINKLKFLTSRGL